VSPVHSAGRHLLMALSILLTAPAIAASPAQAAITGVFAGHTVTGAPIPCAAQSDGVRVCHGTYDDGAGGSDIRLRSFDGVPLEVYVVLPPAPAEGADGPYPLIVQSHGWDGPTTGPGDTQFYGPTGDQWARDGFAALELVARGWGGSCGSMQSRLADSSACAGGYIRLDDDRYEMRDIQYAVGLLVDEGVVDPGRIGATGESYGGGVSLQLATLKDRVMLPDGATAPWRSPNGTPLRIAAAAPVIPWSDLVYSLLPNGRTLDYRVTSSTADLRPLGVEKQSFVSGLFALGAKDGYYAPPGTDPQADLTSWFAAINAGEPYDTNAQDEMIARQIAQYHSAYYLLDGAYGVAHEPPAPLLIANGFTDDLFPVDEALRYYNLERSLYPSDPVALLDGDFGHMRAQNKPADKALLFSRIKGFFDYYLRGVGGPPPLGVTATVETCPASARSGATFHAADWAGLHPGEVDFSSAKSQTVSSSAGDPTISKTIDPVTGGGACATVSSADQGAGVATYRLPKVTGAGYTLLGSPTITARLAATGSFPILAARLWDVDPAAGTQTLVARGVYRLDPTNPNGTQTFQLHPGAWHFASGHIPKLELLGNDSPYVRSSNGQFQIDVSDLKLRLPVHEQPGAPGTPGAVRPAQPPFGPAACTPRPVSKLRRVRANRHRLIVAGVARELTCPNARPAVRRREHVVAVYVIVYRRAAHRRCRFLTVGGRLSGPRSCGHPIRLRARGVRRWTLRLRVVLPPGRYFVRSQAVDALGHRERSARTPLSFTTR
jgi:dienelactone hydrolase